jgi:ribonuclease HI
LKCNVDCALFNNSSITGYGICIRDSARQLVLGLSNFSHYSSSPAEAEALGLLEAIKFSIDSGMNLVIFESDSKIVIDVVNSDSVPQNELGDIVHRCKDLLATHNGYVVRHVRRQANKVAHTIARAALSYPSPHIFSDVPDYLYSLLLNEMA